MDSFSSLRILLKSAYYSNRSKISMYTIIQLSSQQHSTELKCVGQTVFLHDSDTYNHFPLSWNKSQLQLLRDITRLKKINHLFPVDTQQFICATEVLQNRSTAGCIYCLMSRSRMFHSYGVTTQFYDEQDDFRFFVVYGVRVRPFAKAWLHVSLNTPSRQQAI